MVRKINFSIIIPALCFVSIGNVHATTINSASCSSSAVQAAVNSAKDGDTVSIPACSDTAWSSAVSVNLSAGRSLTVQGAGIGQTNIVNQGFDFTGADGKPWRLTGMTLKGSAGVSVGGQSKNFRIDHVYFDHPTGHTQGRVIWIQPSGGYNAYTTGLIDHCTFDHPSVESYQYRGNMNSGGNNEWGRPLALGTADAVYLEDNTFAFDGCVVSAPVTNCDGGGNFVFRHNTVTNSYLEMHDAIIGSLRGCRKWEIYDNTFNNTGGNICNTNARLRSGSGVLFGNIFNGSTKSSEIQLNLYRTYQTAGNPWDTLCSNSSGKACMGASYPRDCNSDADCGGAPGSCVAKDGTSSSPSGYPCRDQIGWYGDTVQTSAPALFWDNKLSGGSYLGPGLTSGQGYYTSGTDYCTNSGTDVPTTCNGMPVTYVPYVYPHPLARAATGTGQTVPSAPKSLLLQ